MAFHEETLESELVYQGLVFDVRRHKVRAVGDKIAYRDVVEHPGGAVMLAIKDDGKILFERQFRKTVNCELLELPAGKRDPGETFEQTAMRELREETGYEAGSIRPLITINPNCGYSSEKLQIFLCRDLVPCEKALDETEDIDLLEFTAEEAVQMVLNREIIDAKTVIGILLARAEGEI